MKLKEFGASPPLLDPPLHFLVGYGRSFPKYSKQLGENRTDVNSTFVMVTDVAESLSIEEKYMNNYY